MLPTKNSNGTLSAPKIFSPNEIDLMSKDELREQLRQFGVTSSFDLFKKADINEMRALLIKKQTKTLPQLPSSP